MTEQRQKRSISIHWLWTGGLTHSAVWLEFCQHNFKQLKYIHTAAHLEVVFSFSQNLFFQNASLLLMTYFHYWEFAVVFSSLYIHLLKGQRTAVCFVNREWAASRWWTCAVREAAHKTRSTQHGFVILTYYRKECSHCYRGNQVTQHASYPVPEKKDIKTATLLSRTTADQQWRQPTLPALLSHSSQPGTGPCTYMSMKMHTGRDTQLEDRSCLAYR